jgi:hypothetical protein
MQGYDTMGSREGEDGWYLFQHPYGGDTPMWVRRGSVMEDALYFWERHIIRRREQPE